MQIVEFVTMTERLTRFDNKEAFQLRTDRPAPWLQKACFWVLRRLRAFYIGETVTIERHAIDGRTFMDRLFKQREGIDSYFNMRPSRLLIGAEDYAELMREVVASQAFSFRAEYGYGREILGMTVEVIPWMRGVLVMPANVRNEAPAAPLAAGRLD